MRRNRVRHRLLLLLAWLLLLTQPALAQAPDADGRYRRLFAEGATGTFFDVRFAVFNPNATAASVTVRYYTSAGAAYQQSFAVAPYGRLTLDPETVPGLEAAAFSTTFESDVPIVVDRTMSWDGSHHSNHAETGTPWPSTTWFLAEGATHSGFELFYLLQNPGAMPADVEVTYLLPSGSPVYKRYRVNGASRFNIWVNREDARLAATDVSAILTSSTPIVVERAMYSREFAAGHASVGITAPATRWYLAEGATGPYFDFFILIANPTDATSDVSIAYLMPDGSRVTRAYQVPGKRRYTIWVDQDDPRLANTAMAAIVESTNGVPILVERAMWWPGPTAGTWQEAHNSVGLTAPAARWALAEGEIGSGADRTRTYTAIANTSSTGGPVRVTLHYEGGGSESRDVALAPGSRFTVDVAGMFPAAAGKRFGTIVESVGTPLALVVEQTSYSDANGVTWAAGTNAAGTPVGAAGGAPQGVPVVSVAATDSSASESGDTARLTFTRSHTNGPLTVRLVTVGSASNADVTPAPQTVAFDAGAATAVVELRAVDDRAMESTELFTVVVAASDSYMLGRDASATIAVADNDVDASVDTPPTAEGAVRFLNQAAFGPTWGDMAAVQNLGYRAWIEAQMNAPATAYTAYIDQLVAGTGETLAQSHLQEAWVEAAVLGQDQLRQRVANALLEIIVVSTANGLGGSAQTIGLSGCMDSLMRNAFGNFRTLLQDVTLNPAMGRFLNMVNNARENERTGRNPNENYAREVLQLFSIGTVRLNIDGTPVLGTDGALIPTYGQTEIQGFAKVFTGWTYGQATQPYQFNAPQNFRLPMVPVAAQHSTAAKPLLDGRVLAAGGTAEQDLTAALDNIFMHPNVGPFIAKRLIQRLVTSNPTPQYVERVATAFNDNGQGVRGDLAAVVRAILLDREARSPATAQAPGYGHLREPMIRFITALRAFNGRAASSRYRAVTNLDGTMGQAPFRSPTVFNFFMPDYVQPGVVSAAGGLVSPEFQITTETTVITATNTIRDLVYRGYGPNDANLVRLDLSPEEALAPNPAALLDRLNLLLFGGQMSQATRDIILQAVNRVAATPPLNRARMAVYLSLMSPEHSIQK